MIMQHIHEETKVQWMTCPKQIMANPELEPRIPAFCLMYLSNVLYGNAEWL